MIKLQNLSIQDKHVIKAVTGWMELSQFEEALRELENVSKECHQIPEILNLKWQILVKMKDWRTSLDVAREFVKHHPGLPTAWIHQSYSLHELNRTIEARDHLLNAREKFPLNPHIVYNLACYTCQLKRDDEAMQWIQEAIALKEKASIISMALEDKDLEPIHERISLLAEAT